MWSSFLATLGTAILLFVFVRMLFVDSMTVALSTPTLVTCETLGGHVE